MDFTSSHSNTLSFTIHTFNKISCSRKRQMKSYCATIVIPNELTRCSWGNKKSSIHFLCQQPVYWKHLLLGNAFVKYRKPLNLLLNNWKFRKEMQAENQWSLVTWGWRKLLLASVTKIRLVGLCYYYFFFPESWKMQLVLCTCPGSCRCWPIFSFVTLMKRRE